MWWKDYVVNFILGIIKCFNIIGEIDPNQVFLTGYSAGGDGVYQLAGALADLLAGAAVMGGHPNKSSCYNLRNIAFSIQAG
jgi:poly(3-hydroxybutyrate) depolymerase